MLCSRAKNEEIVASLSMPTVNLQKSKHKRHTKTSAPLHNTAVFNLFHYYDHKQYIRVLRVHDRWFCKQNTKKTEFYMDWVLVVCLPKKVTR